MKQFLTDIHEVHINNHIVQTDTELIEVNFRNSAEPFYMQHYMIKLNRKLSEYEWKVEDIFLCNEHWQKPKHLGRLYAQELMEQIKHTVCSRIEMKQEKQDQVM